jgi:hypothetical protein
MPVSSLPTTTRFRRVAQFFARSASAPPSNAGAAVAHAQLCRCRVARLREPAGANATTAHAQLRLFRILPLHSRSWSHSTITRRTSQYRTRGSGRRRSVNATAEPCPDKPSPAPKTRFQSLRCTPRISPVERPLYSPSRWQTCPQGASSSCHRLRAFRGHASPPSIPQEPAAGSSE